MALSSSLPENSNDPKPQVHLSGSPIADIISVESVVNLLIQKGVCTAEELFEQERKRLQYEQTFGQIELVQTNRALPSGSEMSLRGMKQNWLKKKMSKRRWARRLGTSLFGWQWKKVKVNRNATGLPTQL